MQKIHKLIISSIYLCLISGCMSYRNTSLDHRLPDFQSPRLQLNDLKSAQSRKGQNPETALALAISGGGHRAANFATGILLGMESTPVPGTNRNLLQEVDYFSTVSGGGFAAGTYLAALHDHLTDNEPEPFLLSKALAANKNRRLYNLRRDYQTSILTQWMHWRCFGFRDAGDLMEKGFDRHLLGSKYRADGKSLLLSDIFKPSSSSEPVRLPYWITNSTVYENGARFMFAPEFITHYQLDRYIHNMRYHNLNDAPLTLPAAVGMKASASFPVLFPASTFSCLPKIDKLNTYLHLVDGGLSDNLGVQTAIELLKNDPAPRKVLIVIDAYTKSPHPYSAHRMSPDGAGVAFRIMKIGLDGEHVRLHENVTRLATENNIEVRFFGFDKLKPALTENMADLRTEIANMRKRERTGTNRRLRRQFDYVLRTKCLELKAARSESKYIYEDACNVATTLNITMGEQAVLLKAGQTIVNQNKSDLTRLLNGKRQAPKRNTP